MDTTSFVDQLYTRFFGRTADPAGRAFWVHALEAAAVDPVKLTSIFLDSGEFSGLVQNVSSLYYTAFGRIPDSGGLAFWLHQAQTGMALDTISAAFTGSAEYQQRLAGNSDAGFIDLLYVGALGQLPDASARAHWLDLLAHGSTRAAVLQGIAQSADVIDHNGPAYKIIAAYQGITGHSPTQTQVEGALAQHDALALIGSLYQSAGYSGVALPGMLSGSGHAGGASDPDHPPSLAGTVPSDGATISGNVITLNFSEDVQAGSGGHIVITDGASQTSIDHTSGNVSTRVVGATDTRILDVGDSQVVFNGQSVIITLSTPLTASAAHYGIQIDAGYIVDTDNLPYAGLPDVTRLGFLTSDTAAPAAPSSLDLVGSSDTGNSNNDNLTNDTTPTISGSAEANATIDLYDGATHIGQSSADSEGFWNVTSAVLGAGAHLLSAKATDAHSNTSPASASLSITIDTTGPSLNAITLSDNLVETGQTSNVTVTFSEAVPNFSASNFEIIDSATLSGFTSADNIVWHATLTPGASIDDATNILQLDMATVLDTAGNGGSGFPNSPNYAVDTKIPAAVVSSVAISDDAGTSASDGLTNVTTQTISGTFTGTLAVGDIVQVFVDSTPHTATVDSPNHYFFVATGLGNGSHGISAQVLSNENYSSGTSSINITIDATAPLISSTTPLNNTSNVPVANNLVYTFSEPVFIRVPTDVLTLTNVTLSSPSQIALNNGQVTVSGNTLTLNPSSNLNTDTLYQLALPAGSLMDAAGNLTPALTFSFSSTDTIPPSDPSGAPLLATSSDTRVNSDRLTNDDTPTYTGTGVQPFTGVALYDTDGTTQLGTATSDLSGNWSITSSALAQGSHTLRVKAFDSANNFSGFSPSSLAVTIDTTAPTLSSAPPATFDRGTPATFTFSEGIFANTGNLVINDGQGDLRSFDVTTLGLTGASSFNFATSTLISGHTYTITFGAGALQDSAGNLAAQVQATVKALPIAPSTPDMSDFDDTGSDSQDNLTKENKPTFQGTAEANTSIALYDNGGGSPIVIGSVDGSGNWSIKLTTGLTDGVHLITAKDVENTSSVHSAPSSALSVTVDTTAPVVESISLSISPMPAGQTSDVTVIFSEPITAFTAAAFSHIDGGTLGSFGSTDNITWFGTFTPTAGGEDDVNTMAIDLSQVVDKAGNAGTGSFTSDNYATNVVTPAAPNTPDLDAASDSGDYDYDNRTNDTTPTFTVSGVAAGATPAIYVEGNYQSDAVTQDNGGGNWSVTLATPLGDGGYYITAKAVSSVGVHSDPSGGEFHITIDTTGPALSTPLPATFAFQSTLVFDFGENVGPGTGNLTFNDGNGDIHQYPVANLDFDGNIYFSTLDLLLGHTYSVTLDAGGLKDSAGNLSGQILGSVTPIPATPSSAPDLDSASDSGTSNVDDLTSDTTPTFTGMIEPSISVYLFDNGIQVGTGSSNTDGNYTVTSSALGTGLHVMTVQAVDTFSHVSASSGQLNVTIDNSAPTTFSVPASVNYLATLVLTFAEDVHPTGSGSIVFKSGATPVDSVLANAGTVTYASNTISIALPGGSLTGGPYSVSIDLGAIEDSAGNVTSATIVGSSTFIVIGGG
ncbi:MAG: Ig-like domain-containing protein [Pseudomonadota bacterium]